MRAAFFSIAVRITALLFRTSPQFGVLHSGRNYDFLRDFLIERRHVIARAIMKDANNSRMGAVDWADNSSLGAAIRPDDGDLHQHTIDVHRLADCRRWNLYVSGMMVLSTVFM